MFQNKSSGTITRHLDCLTYLSKRFPALGVKEIEGYFFDSLQKGHSPSHLNNVVGALRTYGKFLQVTDYQKLKYFKVPETTKAILSDSEIDRYLALPPTGVRIELKKYTMYTLFFTILAYSGMRPAEVANLTVDSVDFGRQVFILKKTKTVPRLVPINPVLIPRLEEYIRSCTNYLFLDDSGQPINRHQWKHQFGRRIEMLGIKRPHLTTYSLRHSFITRMLDEDINLFKIQKIVGHKKIETTAHYTHLTTKDILQTIRKDPLARGSLSYAERFTQFRSEVRKLLEAYAENLGEEQEMLKALS